MNTHSLNTFLVDAWNGPTAAGNDIKAPGWKTQLLQVLADKFNRGQPVTKIPVLSSPGANDTLVGLTTRVVIDPASLVLARSGGGTPLPPGFTDSATAGEIIAEFPLGGFWDITLAIAFEVTFSIRGLGAVTIPLKETIQIDNFHLGLTLDINGVETNTPGQPDLSAAFPLPSVRGAALNPTMVVHVGGDAVSTNFALDGTTRQSNGTYAGKISVTSTGNLLKFNGTWQLNPGLPLNFHIAGKGTVADLIHVFTLDRTLTVDPLPKNAPVLWGSDDAVGKTVVDTPNPPVTPASLLARANDVQQKLITGHAPSVGAGSLQCLFAMDNRYPAKTAADADGITATADTSAVLYRGTRDSAIWTGHLLAAQSFRYGALIARGAAQTDLDQARSDALMTLNAILRLFALPQYWSGFPGVLSRIALPEATAKRVQANDDGDQTLVTTGQGDDSDYYPASFLDGQNRPPWYGHGRDFDAVSRDQILGIVLGLTTAYRLFRPAPGAADLPADQNLRTSAASALTNMLSLIVRNTWNMPTPRTLLTVKPSEPAVSDWWTVTTFVPQFYHQIALLRVGKLLEDEGMAIGAPPNLFNNAYATLSAASGPAWLSLWFEALGGLNSYFKYNLDHAAMGLLLWLENDPPQGAPGATPGAHYDTAFQTLRNQIVRHRNPYFNLLWVLGATPGAARRARLEGVAPATRSTAAMSLRQEILHCLYEWTQRVQLPGGGGPNGMPLSATPRAAFDAASALWQNEPHPKTNAGGSLQMDAPLRWQYASGVDLDFMWQHQAIEPGITTPGPTGRVNVTAVDFGDRRPLPKSPDPRFGPGNATLIEAPGVDYLIASYLYDYVDATS